MLSPFFLLTPIHTQDFCNISRPLRESGQDYGSGSHETSWNHRGHVHSSARHPNTRLATALGRLVHCAGSQGLAVSE